VAVGGTHLPHPAISDYPNSAAGLSRPASSAASCDSFDVVFLHAICSLYLQYPVENKLHHCIATPLGVVEDYDTRS